MKLFGYPKFDAEGVRTLCTYTNEYSHMLMDIRIYRLKAGETRSFARPGEEIALLLQAGSGQLTVRTEGKIDHQSIFAHRRDVFTEGPYAAHVSTTGVIEFTAASDSEFLVQCTHNEKEFEPRLYAPEDVMLVASTQGKYGNVANRMVNTVFDYEHEPWSNMVLGEVMNDRGNWSGYLPHSHPQPECYYFLFDRPEGFGASFVGDQVFKSTNGSFSAIPGGALHPQAVAPGYRMYTVWMIRHLDGQPWLQTDRCEDEHYVWLHDAVQNVKPIDGYWAIKDHKS